jgi:hypothetical protein
VSVGTYCRSTICRDYAYAKPLFTLAEELGVIERQDGDVVTGADVRAAQESRHRN